MKTINVEGLPDTVVKAMEVVVETMRKELHPPEKPASPKPLPRWPGKAVGELSRREIYEDV